MTDECFELSVLNVFLMSSTAVYKTMYLPFLLLMYVSASGSIQLLRFFVSVVSFLDCVLRCSCICHCEIP